MVWVCISLNSSINFDFIFCIDLIKEDLEKAMEKLIKQRYLIAVNRESFINPIDREIMAEEKELASRKEVGHSAKDLAAIRQTIRQQYAPDPSQILGLVILSADCQFSMAPSRNEN